MSFEEKEKQIDQFISQNEKEEAVKLMFDLIVNYAKEKKFEKADSLREKLIKVDSMALTQIINSAEIIEKEKSKAIDLAHKKIWSGLYDGFTDEEVNAFYFSLKKIKIKPSKIIQQGRLNNRLFFVDQGKLKVICASGYEETFIKNITEGEPIGIDTFFSISLATTSVMAVESVKMHYLERETFLKLVEKFPGFDSKLEGLCKKLVKETVEVILKNREVNRRGHHRFRVNGKVAVHLIDSKGEPAKTPFYGVLEDISEGGLSFSINNSSKEKARLFLGRQAAFNIISEHKGVKEAKIGKMVSVYNQLFNTYMVSLKFSKPLSPVKVRQFVNKD